MFDLFGEKRRWLERQLRDIRKQRIHYQNLNDELILENMRLRSELSKSVQSQENVNESTAPTQKPKVYYKIIDPNEDNIVLSKREFINAWNKWGSLNPHTLWNLLKIEAK